MSLRINSGLPLFAAALLLSTSAWANPKAPSNATAKAPGVKAAKPAPKPIPASSPATRPADPFAKLVVKIPKDRLPPLRSVRIRDQRESPAGNIRLRIGSAPSGATVRHGGRVLGKTPLVLRAPYFSTPMDLVLSRGGYMVLRTRVHRDKSRGYFFKLNPAKFR